MLHVIASQKAKNIVATDQNHELINFYTCLKRNPRHIHSLFSSFRNDKETYYQIRAWDRDEGYSSMEPIMRAARFLYLNKTSFQGMWRVARHGCHNAPYGRRKNVDVSLERIMNFADVIKDVSFVHCDFERIAKMAKPGDFVYMDPPYYPTSPSAGFTQYVPGAFNHGEQIRLRDVCRSLSDAGVDFLLSQSDCIAVHELYGEFSRHQVPVSRTVAAKSGSRGQTTELLIGVEPCVTLGDDVVQSSHGQEDNSTIPT